jgi:hypothetical protein
MNEFIKGALFSKPDVRDYVATTTLTEFPKEFELDMPRVKNQGAVGSCVAHALSTIVEYFSQKEMGWYTEMSTGYIYGNRRLSAHKGKGMYTRDAINTVTKYGDVPQEYYPLNVEVPNAIENFEARVDEIEEKGYCFKFAEYFKLKDEQSIKASLMENGPVAFAMSWYEDIKINDGVMQTKCVKNAKTGAHCMVIYGWNETGWKVQNSWGVFWGKGGRVVIPYDVKLREVWGIKDAASNGSLILKKPFRTKIGEIIAKILNKILILFYHGTKEV